MGRSDGHWATVLLSLKNNASDAHLQVDELDLQLRQGLFVHEIPFLQYLQQQIGVCKTSDSARQNERVKPKTGVGRVGSLFFTHGRGGASSPCRLAWDLSPSTTHTAGSSSYRHNTS
jgi:hypothetical protein